ncbi:MAG TPA: hypothetical protein VGS57_06055 [Thermoanaerobaculia bacterium]|jgi:hypothetical protein|nr:hypothetical protein [Thermoanaerobaculia bacterium]
MNASWLHSLLGRRFRKLSPALAVLFVLGCHDSPTEVRGEVSFQNVTKAKLVPRVGPDVREVVRDQARWEEVWRELYDGAGPPRPQIDFRREMAIVATASLTCFGDVEVESVERDRDGVLVKIADAGPAPLCLCFAAEYVFQVVRATRVDGPVSFAVRTTPPRCG